MASAAQPAFDLAALMATAIGWRDAGSDAEVPWRADFNGNSLALRLNDFPEEPMYTLLVNGNAVGDFDDWPTAWTRTAGRS